MNKTSDLKFVLLLVMVIGLVGFIAYLNTQNLLKSKEAANVLIKEKDEITLIGMAKNRVKDTCYCEFTKNTLENKLIVMTTNIDCEFTKEKSKKLFDTIPWGSASKKILFKSNKIQFKVPLDNDKIKVDFNNDTKSIKITTPPVVLDRDMVEVQTKPSLIEKEENGSWLPGGPDLKEIDKEIMEEVRDSILLIAASQKNLRALAKEQAQKVVYNFFYMILSEFLKENKIGLEVYIP